jgi:biopolymer transport protein ExbD
MVPSGLIDTKIRGPRGAIRPADIQAALPLSKDKLVVLEGDEKILLGTAVQVMDRARKAGAQRFAIATKSEK